ncbi:catenin alpha-2-like [Tachysurus ichikawai]
MTSATSPILLKWDPKSLEIRTLTVERLLEPLVTQVPFTFPLLRYSESHHDGYRVGRLKRIVSCLVTTVSFSLVL